MGQAELQNYLQTPDSRTDKLEVDNAKIDSNFSKKCEKFWVTYLSHYIIGKSILKEEVLHVP